MSCEGSPDFFFAHFQRADGFYHADVNGQLGLVPGSFLDDYTNGVRCECQFQIKLVFNLF